MNEAKATPYPLRTEGICDVVCEPTADYGKSIVYQGTTIANALKDYYTFSTNHEKVDVLKWIVAQPEFTELQRFSTAENKIYTLYTNQYDEILKTGEIPNNLQIAQKFVANGYDVFLLSNPKATKSADFIIRRRNCLYYVEGKTSTGGNALTVRLSDTAKQANRIAINLIFIPSFHEIYTTIKNGFENNPSIDEIFLFKGHKLILISRNIVTSKRFDIIFKTQWSRNK